jgi:hypothetical protein
MILMIDSHSHIGRDSFHPIEGDLEEYVSIALQLGIKSANLMPVPCPRYEPPDGTEGGKIQSLEWSFEGVTITPYKIISERDGRTTKIKNPINPYQEYNKIVEEKIKEVKAIKIQFIPLVHPVLDTPEYLESILKKHPKAVKIHGVAAGISPKEIPKYLLEMLSKYNIPLIIHTDFISGGKPKNGLEYICHMNKPTDWIEVLEKNNLKAFLAHGARLCPESISIVRNSQNLLIGISPDILLASEPNRLACSERYLEHLISTAGPKKIALDLDYPWNIRSREDKKLEWGVIDRIKNLMSKEEFKQVTQTNASLFFGI